jgi:hypothetical protein
MTCTLRKCHEKNVLFSMQLPPDGGLCDGKRAGSGPAAVFFTAAQHFSRRHVPSGHFVQEDDMTTRLAFLSLALVGIAGLAHAQSMGSSTAYPYPSTQQAMGAGSCGHSASITDEYGFKYDSMGNRLNGQGCVIAPPVTPPGARAIQNR